jgi:hypothetical protein
MSLAVLARMTVANELRRQSRLGIKVINDKVVEGLLVQRQNVEGQQQQFIKLLVMSVFLSFVAWRGGKIQIPGTGASITEIPAFLEISLVVAALSLMWLPYIFLSLQLYDAVIQSIVKHISASNVIDEDIVVASKQLIHLFIKYARRNVVIGRESGYLPSRGGRVYNLLLVGLPMLAYAVVFLLLFASVLVIAHLGLDSGLVGWSVYLFCWFAALIGVFAVSANFVSPKYEMDFAHLESI